MIRTFINANIAASRCFDRRFLPEELRRDGNNDFLHEFAPKWVQANTLIYDVGGGKNPFLSVEQKQALHARVTGIDISKHELELAPHGAYDSIICSAIEQVRGTGDGDIVICQAVLEHVPDTQAAFLAITSLLKPGGVALIFVPSRNAVYSIINRLLPQSMKKKILHTIYPSTRRGQGFVSYYHLCTPKDFFRLASDNNLDVVEQRYYYISSYFSFFFPFFVTWRAWILLFKALAGEQAAETFSLALQKNDV